jgi:hypothetical protein
VRRGLEGYRVTFHSFVRAGACVFMTAFVAVASAAAQQMPDPSQIHGKAIPAPELPNATVTVRVVRENIGNNVPEQIVTVRQGSVARSATTDDQGRAQFKDLPAGSNWRAETTVDGEALVSDPFEVPAAGGLRVILVAGIAKAAERRQQEETKALEAPPVKGSVVIGGDSRVLMQFRDDALTVYYVLEIVNNARSRVDIGGPLIIDLPASAAGAGTLEGTPTSATITGNRLTVVGPFAPGVTPVQIAYQLRYDDPSFVFEQAFPAPLQNVTVVVQKVRDLAVASPQFQQVRDLNADDGTVFTVGNGPGLPAGSKLTVTLSNLPIASRTPRYVALTLAAAVIALGVWLSVRGVQKQGNVRSALEARRTALLDELEALEVRRRSGALSAERYASRRQKLVAELEQIYGELDEAGYGPRGDGEGIPTPPRPRGGDPGIAA